MPKKRKLSKKELEKAAKLVYHHIDCSHMEGLTITLTKKEKEYKKIFSIIGLSSKKTIKKGMRAVDLSPFKTVFIVDEESGKVLFALSKNVEYVAFCRKKKPPPPPPPPQSMCCRLCGYMGGYACDSLSDGSCICYGADRDAGTGAGLDDPLDMLSP